MFKVLEYKCVPSEKTLPGSSGVFNTDGSAADLLRSPTGVLALFSVLTALCFLSLTGVLYISEIPGNKSINTATLIQEQSHKDVLYLAMGSYQSSLHPFSPPF